MNSVLLSFHSIADDKRARLGLGNTVPAKHVLDSITRRARGFGLFVTRRRDGALIDPDESLYDQAQDGEEEGEEGEGLEGVLLAAAAVAAGVGGAAGEVVVVLGFEDHGREPSGKYVSVCRHWEESGESRLTDRSRSDREVSSASESVCGAR